MTTVEHNIPIPVLYDDVLRLYALSGTAAVPTHVRHLFLYHKNAANASCSDRQLRWSNG
jgi:hypothetical protein